MEQIINFLKWVPKYVYIIVILLVMFLWTMQYQKMQEASKIINAEKQEKESKLSDDALLKAKEQKTVVDNPVWTGTQLTKEASINQVAPMNNMTMKFKKPIVMWASDFKSTIDWILITRNWAIKLWINIDWNLILPINKFLNWQLSGITTIKNKWYQFSFDNNFIITSASVPWIPDNEKMVKLRQLYADMVTALQTKQDYTLWDTVIKNDNLTDKIIEVRKSIGELAKTTKQLPTNEYNWQNIIELMWILHVD